MGKHDICIMTHVMIDTDIHCTNIKEVHCFIIYCNKWPYGLNLIYFILTYFNGKKLMLRKWSNSRYAMKNWQFWVRAWVNYLLPWNVHIMQHSYDTKAIHFPENLNFSKEKRLFHENQRFKVSSVYGSSSVQLHWLSSNLCGIWLLCKLLLIVEKHYKHNSIIHE